MSIFGVNLLKYKLTFSSLDLGFTIDIKFNEYIWILGAVKSDMEVHLFDKIQIMDKSTKRNFTQTCHAKFILREAIIEEK